MPKTTRIFPPLPRVGPIGFLRSLITIGCLGLPLILLQTHARGTAVVSIAWFGYLILGVLWWVKLVGRLEDAGWWTAQLASGVSLIIGVLAIGILRQIAGLRAHSYLLFVLAHPASIFPTWLRPTSDYEMLGLFLLIQVPLALLPTKPRPEYLVAPQYPKSRIGKQLGEFQKHIEERRKRLKRKPLGALPLLGAILLIGVVWLPLIYMDSASSGGIGTWLSRIGYVILGSVWVGCIDARLQDAGSAKSADLWQFCLIVAVASLMPLGLHWVSGYGAFAIFILLQIPPAFLPSKTTVSQSTETPLEP